MAVILHQTAITQPLPPHARYLELRLRSDAAPKAALKALAIEPPKGAVIGLGASLIGTLGGAVHGLHELTPSARHGVTIPSTPAALWIWLRGTDRGVLVEQSRACVATLQPAFELIDTTDGFVYREGRDLSGYIDGTENPKDDAAIDAAIVQGAGAGLDGGSFVAVQRWQHDLNHFATLDQTARDHIVGRQLSDNTELSNAPASAHVKRAAQESFAPAAFMLRRSMPWADARGEGLVFVAFGNSLDAFDAVLRRMSGAEDGITDGLFRFTRPVSGSTFWCPPMAGSRLDLSALGL